jgi:hypothetical protein
MEQQAPDLFDVQLDQQSFTYLGEAARWAKFIAIVGFIFCGLLVLIALFAGTILASMSTALGDLSSIGGALFTVIYLVFAIIAFFPNLYLYKFAVKMQRTIRMNEHGILQDSLRNLKSYFRFLGILFIIVLCFYALAFIGGILTGIAGSS